MATMNVSLPDQMKAWVEDQTRTGEFGNASDYIRDLIRHDQERRRGIAEIAALVAEGRASGPASPLDLDKFLVQMNEERAEQHETAR